MHLEIRGAAIWEQLKTGEAHRDALVLEIARCADRLDQLDVLYRESDTPAQALEYLKEARGQQAVLATLSTKLEKQGAPAVEDKDVPNPLQLALERARKGA